MSTIPINIHYPVVLSLARIYRHTRCVTQSMPRFLVLQSLEPNGLPKPIVEVPDSDTILQAATQTLERIDEIRSSLMLILHNASHRRLLEYTAGETVASDPVENAEGVGELLANQQPPEYPLLGPLSGALEAIDTQEEVFDLIEDATMDVIHTAFGQTDPATNEWRPPSHAQQSFGSNAWHGLACMWLLVLVMMAVGVLYNRSRRAWRRTLNAHNKFL
jgi:hypothetical protein